MEEIERRHLVFVILVNKSRAPTSDLLSGGISMVSILSCLNSIVYIRGMSVLFVTFLTMTPDESCEKNLRVFMFLVLLLCFRLTFVSCPLCITLPSPLVCRNIYINRADCE